MAKIISINQKVIESCTNFLAFLDEYFLEMSFEERVEKYQSYLKVKEMTEDLMKRAQGKYEHPQHQDINEPKA